MVWSCVYVSTGYLQQEGLSGTSRAFIQESPNLKEYAEHSTDDGLIPACVFVSVLKVYCYRQVPVLLVWLFFVSLDRNTQTYSINDQCMFLPSFQSLFGKNLKTILNEYVASKTKGKYSALDTKCCNLRFISLVGRAILMSSFIFPKRNKSRKPGPCYVDIIMEEAGCHS